MTSTAGVLSLFDLRDAMKHYDTLAAAAKDAFVGEIFDRVSRYPQCFQILGTDFAEMRFGSHPFAASMIAAHRLGTGEIGGAHQILAEINQQSPTPFNALMAARCLMRPAGREIEAERYLTDQAARFPRDLTINGNLAAARFACGQTVQANTTLAPFVDELKERLSSYDEEHDALKKEIEAALANKTHYRRFRFDEMSYREEIIWTHWEPYYDWMLQQSPQLMFGWLRSAYRQWFTELSDGVSEFYNFGVMCALPDYEAALQKPDVQFIGVDRQHATAEHNKTAFSAPNLHFMAGEIEDALNNVDAKARRALFHGRTGTLCYPEKLRRIYKLCADKGVKRIGLFENAALSHASYCFMNMDEIPDLVIYKSDQFIHNYPKFLSDAGYRVLNEQRMFSPLITPFPDLEIGSVHTYIVAEID